MLGKYALGVRPTKAGYETFDVVPNLMAYNSIEGTVPVLDGYVKVKMDKNSLSVLTDREGGTLKINGKEYKLEKDKELTLNL